MITLLLFAQIAVSHFVRLPMPAGKEWVTTHRQPLKCEGDFVMPASGKYTLRYTTLSCDLGKPPQEYRNVPVAPLFCEHKDCAGGNQEPIYDVDESYDHITVQSKPGTHWWYAIVMAVSK